MINNENTHRLTFQDKEITLVGTAHVSRESTDLVEQVIEQEKPDTVCIELCQSRYQSITQKKQWQDMNLFKVIREKKASLLLINFVLAYFQKKIGQKLGIKPGEEIIRAIKVAQAVGARIHLADRDIRTTLSRTWRLMGLWTKIKLLAQFLASAGQLDAIKEEDVEKMKKKDVLEMLLFEMGESLPEIKRVLIITVPAAPPAMKKPTINRTTIRAGMPHFRKPKTLRLGGIWFSMSISTDPSQYL